jgi:PAS domain S-box-containing protein
VISNRGVEAERWVNHTLQVREEIQRLKSTEAEASASVRAYFITGDVRFAAEARKAIAAFDVTRQKLADLTKDNPNQTQRGQQVASLERSRVERIISAMTRFQVGVLQPDQLRPALKAAEIERLGIEDILKAMEEEENSLLEGRSRRVDALRADLRTITAIWVFLGVTGGVVISILFALGITNRIGRLRQNVARLATGGVLDLLPEGRDEIGALSEWVARTTEILRQRTAALENASHGIAQIDGAGHYLDFNPAYSQLTGLDDVRSAPGLAETVHPDDQHLVEEAVSQMLESGRTEIEARVVHPDRRVVDVEMTLVSTGERREAGYFVFLRDITRRKEAESALLQAKDAAMASSLAKNEFLARISHDIRTPLNAVLGAADLLSQSPLNSDQTGYVEMFQRNSRRVVALINDFLDFSKIEAGAVRVESIPYRVRATVQEAVATFRESANRKGVKLAAEIAEDVPEWELGDPLRVHQVLVNLLSNALKFTQRGRVEVSVLRIAEPEGEQLRIAVSDTGPGICAEDQQQIFAAFAQSRKPDLRARDGCGLGLASCRELVELMGGAIGVTSQEGSGSTFHFTLPLVEAQCSDMVVEASVRAASPQRPEAHGPIRVLAAEDNSDNRMLLQHYVRGQPIELHFAENGQEAVDAIRRTEEFDLILMDMDMPVLDGIEATRVIRAWESERDAAPIPIIVLSAHAMREAVRACLEAGCAAHVAKPVDRVTLLNTIQHYARRRSRSSASSSVSNVSTEVSALVPKYLGTKLRQIEEARANLAAKDLDPIRRFGHNLKGTGTGYGFPRIAEIGSEMEQAAKNHDERSIAEQLDALGEFLAQEQAAAVRE